MYMYMYTGTGGECDDINCEIFVVKIFSDSMGNVKIKRMKIMCTINTNAVRGRLSEII